MASYRALDLSQPALTFGRAADSDLAFPFDAQVSRHHAQIRRSDHALVIEDLGSQNGTFVNGTRLSSPHLLLEGDRIQVGQSTLQFARGQLWVPDAAVAMTAPPTPNRSAVPLAAGVLAALAIIGILAYSVSGGGSSGIPGAEPRARSSPAGPPLPTDAEISSFAATATAISNAATMTAAANAGRQPSASASLTPTAP